MIPNVNAKLAKMQRAAVIREAVPKIMKLRPAQKQVQVEEFTFEGKNYEVRVFLDNKEINAQTFLDGKPVSPRCTCDWEIAWDYKTLHGQEAVKILVGWARDFVEDKTWEKYQQAMAELKKYSNK